MPPDVVGVLVTTRELRERLRPKQSPPRFASFSCFSCVKTRETLKDGWCKGSVQRAGALRGYNIFNFRWYICITIIDASDLGTFKFQSS